MLSIESENCQRLTKPFLNMYIVRCMEDLENLSWSSLLAIFDVYRG